MPVNITSIAVKNEFRSESVDWLLANVGDKITIELELDVNTYSIASTDNLFVLNKTDGVLLTAGSFWIEDEKAGLADFKVGDTIRLFQYTTATDEGIHTILEKLDDSLIRVSGVTAWPVNTNSSSHVVSVTVPITSIFYKWNFIENGDAVTFESKIDGSEQLMFQKDLDASVVTPVAMIFTGNKSYQIGSATIQGAGIDTGSTDGVYNSKFKIIHQTFLTPFILAAQWDGLLSLTAPDYYFNDKCLKGIFDIEALYNYNDPNRIQTIQETEALGNTGWFNENFNTGLTNYSVDSIVCKRPDTSVISAIELSSTSETTVEIVIKNLTDTPFSNNNTKFALNFSRVPDNEADYQLNGQTIIENFFFDRALQTLGSAAVNGDNFGTENQVLKTIVGTFISSSEIKITFQVDMDAHVVDTIEDTDAHQYMLWVAIQNHTLETKKADKVALLADAELFFEDTDDASMIINDNSFLRHYSSDVDTEAVSSLSMFPNDDVVGYSRFYIDRTGRPDDVIVLKSVEVRLKAYNEVTLEEFTLESFKLDLSSMPVINDYQFVDFALERQFHIPPAEIRKTIRVRRRPDLDVGLFHYYDIIYPYMHRWEYWEKLAGVNGDFFDMSEPNNGFNHFWHRYTTLANWGFAYSVIIKATKNGDTQTYNEQTLLGSHDYDSNPDWLPATIKSYEDSTNTLLTTGGTNYILGYAATRIEAEFTKISAPPVLSTLRMVIWIEVFEEGGINGSRRISSVYEYDSDTWFKSTDASKKIVLSVLGNTAKGIALIDFTKIPLDKKQFKITARIYEVGAAAIDNKLFQDGDNFLFQDGDNYLFQDQ